MTEDNRMYALHPEVSLPPKTIHGKREEFTAEQLAAYYKLEKWEYIVWDPQDPSNEGLEYLDFIHLYPMYYGRYMLNNRKPQPDVPCNFVSASLGGRTAGSVSRQSHAAISTSGKKKSR